jgi:hypothetical protein
MKSHFRVHILVVTVVMVFSWSPAHGLLRAVGPIEPLRNFPLWYEDFTGLQLQLCLDMANCFFEPAIPNNPTSELAGFGVEAFYWEADAFINTAPGSRVSLLMALGAGWRTPDGNPAPGTEKTFGMIRVRITGLTPGQAYAVTHPFGTLNLVANQDGVINNTDDIGCLDVIPGPFVCDFSLALFSSIGPNFLTAVAPPPPAGFIGNPFIEQTLTGSPFDQNFFRVEGPDVGGLGIHLIQTDLFAVQGKIFGQGAVEVEIDIKPGSDPNCFNPSEHGSIPVAIFGSATINVNDVDMGSLSLQGLSVKMTGEKSKYLAHFEDIDNDGYGDLVVQFQDSDGWVNSGDGFATLKGNLKDGTAIEGEDDVCIAPGKTPNSPPSGPNLQRCFCQDGSQIEFCAVVDCDSGPAQDLICGPACVSLGGVFATGCFVSEPICSVP